MWEESTWNYNLFKKIAYTVCYWCCCQVTKKSSHKRKFCQLNKDRPTWCHLLYYFTIYIFSDIRLVYLYSPIKMMHGPLNIRFINSVISSDVARLDVRNHQSRTSQKQQSRPSVSQNCYALLPLRLYNSWFIAAWYLRRMTAVSDKSHRCSCEKTGFLLH